jgi:hypothetical protein
MVSAETLVFSVKNGFEVVERFCSPTKDFMDSREKVGQAKAILRSLKNINPISNKLECPIAPYRAGYVANSLQNELPHPVEGWGF